jgi:hypothetical protein
MAAVERRLLYVEGVGSLGFTYDDTLTVGDDISNCDLISLDVVVEAGRTAKFTIEELPNVVWQESTGLVGPIDANVAVVGIDKVSDLSMVVFGGDE